MDSRWFLIASLAATTAAAQDIAQTRGAWRYLAWTNAGATNSLVMQRPITASVLAVGGGGGGGNSRGYNLTAAGAGGAGGLVFVRTKIPAMVGNIVVGRGGAGNTNDANGADGDATAFWTLVAYGGGGGGGKGLAGSPGASGGGGGYIMSGGAGIGGQGFAGANGGFYSGGGGGGYANTPTNADNTAAERWKANGGAGTNMSWFLSGLPIGANGFFCGGGGGGAYTNASIATHGGGNGGLLGVFPASNAVATSGGGGGGGTAADDPALSRGGDGGSGCIIVRIDYRPPLALAAQTMRRGR